MNDDQLSALVQAHVQALTTQMLQDAEQARRSIEAAVSYARIGDGDGDDIRADDEEADAYSYAANAARLGRLIWLFNGGWPLPGQRS